MEKRFAALAAADRMIADMQANRVTRLDWLHLRTASPIPEGAMRVAPGSDAVVWRINSDSCGEL